MEYQNVGSALNVELLRPGLESTQLRLSAAIFWSTSHDTSFEVSLWRRCVLAVLCGLVSGDRSLLRFLRRISGQGPSVLNIIWAMVIKLGNHTCISLSSEIMRIYLFF